MEVSNNLTSESQQDHTFKNLDFFASFLIYKIFCEGDKVIPDRDVKIYETMSHFLLNVFQSSAQDQKIILVSNVLREMCIHIKRTTAAREIQPELRVKNVQKNIHI